MNSFYNDPAVELDPKLQRNLKLNWDDIQSIQDLYGAPKSSKTNRKQFREENVKGPYSAAVAISPSRIMVKNIKNFQRGLVTRLGFGMGFFRNLKYQSGIGIF